VAFALRRRKMLMVGMTVLGLGVATPASATLLNLPIQHPLLSFDNGGTLAYDADANALSVDAFPIALQLSPGAAPLFITPIVGDGESFEIDATVDETGAASGGSLLVTGRIEDLGDLSGDLLLGDVIDFGFQENGATDLFEFAIEVTGGLLVDEGVYALRDTVVVKLQSERSTFNDSFESDFRGGAKGTLGNVPEPGSMLLLAAGIYGLTLYGRRRA
jgi:hypothetical protein